MKIALLHLSDIHLTTKANPILVKKVEESREQLRSGKGLSTGEARKKLKKWLK